MRLIDADELIINLYHNKKVVLNDDLVKCIDDTETAYDVEKVVEELEKIRAKDTCNKEKCDTKEICRICVVDDAIEIIKHGGVSDDACEWKEVVGFDYMYIINPHTNKLYSNEPSMKNIYCNTCGKKIKLVEQMDEDELRYCHHDDTDEYHDCLDYMECEECPYYYADLDQEGD